MPAEAEVEKGKKSQAETIDELMEYLKQGGSLGLEIEKRLEALPEKYVALVVVRQDKYDVLVSHLVKNFRKEGIPGIFVTLNKDAKSLVEMLNKNNVDCNDIFIVDAISKTKAGRAETNGNISFVGSPNDLTEMEAQIMDFVERLPPGNRFFIFDSLSTMLIYNAEKTVEKFVHSLSERLRSLGFKTIFTIMESGNEEIMSVLAQFCDKAIKPVPRIRP